MKKFLSFVVMVVVVVVCFFQSVIFEFFIFFFDVVVFVMVEIKFGVDYYLLLNFGEMKVIYLDLDLIVDFDVKWLKGSVIFIFDKFVVDVSELVLDIWDLDIQLVFVNGESFVFMLDEVDFELGVVLCIQVLEGINQVMVFYQIFL